jgi:hypothetical protein
MICGLVQRGALMSHTLSFFPFYLEIATKGLLFHFALLFGLCGLMFSCLFHCACDRHIEDNVFFKCGGEFLCLGPLDALFFLNFFFKFRLLATGRSEGRYRSQGYKQGSEAIQRLVNAMRSVAYIMRPVAEPRIKKKRLKIENLKNMSFISVF